MRMALASVQLAIVHTYAIRMQYELRAHSFVHSHSGTFCFLGYVSCWLSVVGRCSLAPLTFCASFWIWHWASCHSLSSFVVRAINVHMWVCIWVCMCVEPPMYLCVWPARLLFVLWNIAHATVYLFNLSTAFRHGKQELQLPLLSRRRQRLDWRHLTCITCIFHTQNVASAETQQTAEMLDIIVWLAGWLANILRLSSHIKRRIVKKKTWVHGAGSPWISLAFYLLVVRHSNAWINKRHTEIPTET